MGVGVPHLAEAANDVGVIELRRDVDLALDFLDLADRVCGGIGNEDDFLDGKKAVCVHVEALVDGTEAAFAEELFSAEMNASRSETIVVVTVSLNLILIVNII